MRVSKSLVGKSIVSIADGRMLGPVSDVFLDKGLSQVVAILTGEEGLWNRKIHLIKRDDVVLYGVDTVLVKQSNVIHAEENAAGFDSWIRRDQLHGRNIDTPGETRIAKLDDVILDEDACVLGFTLGRTYIDSPVAESGAVSRDVIIDTGGEDGIMTIDLEKAEQEKFHFPT